MTLTSAPTFEAIEGWEQVPAGVVHRDVAGVAVDSRQRVYLLTRGDERVLVYAPGGEFLTSWGEGLFSARPHGITIGPDDAVYCVDDDAHNVMKFSADGTLLMTLGTAGVASDTGYDGTYLSTITHGGPPFNHPTNLAVAPNGNLYISDGYGNARVHQFSAKGELLRSWGAPGTEPGRFHLPHGIAVDADGRILVCDRENDRIQVFEPDGVYLAEWTTVQRPTHVQVAPDGTVYVSELWWQTGQRSFTRGAIEVHQYGRVSILDASGAVLARLGGGEPGTPGNFTAPHSLALDAAGDLYVAEVSYTHGVSGGLAPPDVPTFQKLRRV